MFFRGSFADIRLTGVPAIVCVRADGRHSHRRQSDTYPESRRISLAKPACAAAFTLAPNKAEAPAGQRLPAKRFLTQYPAKMAAILACKFDSSLEDSKWTNSVQRAGEWPESEDGSGTERYRGGRGMWAYHDRPGPSTRPERRSVLVMMQSFVRLRANL